jgi:predicted RNA-binding Zn ribbon-like protein
VNWACIDLINSLEWDAYGHPTEHLDDPKWIEKFIERYALPLGKMKPGAPDLRTALREFRTELRPLFDRVAAEKGRVTERELAPLRAKLGTVNWRRTLAKAKDGVTVGTSPDETGNRAVVATLAESAARLFAETQTERLKHCANPLCRWMFVDETKGNVRRWCHDVLCGRLDRVKRFREKARRQGS